MSGQTLNVLIGGEAGQGLATVGDLLSKCLVRSGYHIVVTQDYMSRVRGGHNTFAIRISPDPITAPAELFDIIVALNKETVELHREQLAEEGLIITDAKFEFSGDEFLNVPYEDLASGRYANTAALGVTGAVLGIEESTLDKALEQAFGKKHPDAVPKNSEALRNSYDWCPESSCAAKQLPKPADKNKRLIIAGNDAIALGAMAAGVKFCAFYPMTPATTVALALSDRAKKLGMVVEQAEDEIAAINMVVGAAYAGAPSLITTSGGGFALMQEGVSLAAMMETPVVVVVVQRPGPATGLPTRTAQADLDFVLHSGHGEFPRAIFTPGNPEECFYLTTKAFEVAEACQGPVFILSDQFLSDSYRAVKPFDLDGVHEIDTMAPHREEIKTPYKRYEITESGVSPRLLPGMSEHLVVSDSDEHTEEGHLTENLEAAKAMMDKRLRKMDVFRKMAVRPEYIGEDPADIVLVCWGSSKGAVLEAAEHLRQEERRIGVLFFPQVWPLDGDWFLNRLESARQVLAVEGNATGQLAGLIRRETGFKIERLINRYDGLPLTPEFILRGLAH